MVRLIAAPRLIVALSLLTAGAAFAQAQRTFDVVSIKTREGPFSVLNNLKFSGPRLMIEAISVRPLITYAYQLRNDQLVTPENIGEVYFDIAATAEGVGEPTNAEFREMMRGMLADRFKLQFHRETRETAVYHLVIDKGGPKLTDSAPDTKTSGRIAANGRMQSMEMKGLTMAEFCRDLPNFVDRPVLDKTGLTKRYDFKFEATPFFQSTRDQDIADLSAFTAVRKQLGLRLEPAKDMVEVMVVDSVTKPTEN